jgi:hypothetical protein
MEEFKGKRSWWLTAHYNEFAYNGAFDVITLVDETTKTEIALSIKDIEDFVIYLMQTKSDLAEKKRTDDFNAKMAEMNITL